MSCVSFVPSLFHHLTVSFSFSVISRMYRVQSEVHRPEIVAQAVIGGKTGSTTHLSSPASVAFTPKGDFVICDTGHKVTYMSLFCRHQRVGLILKSSHANLAGCDRGDGSGDLVRVCVHAPLA